MQPLPIVPFEVFGQKQREKDIRVPLVVVAYYKIFRCIP